nr:SDR family NAD(P)-dependent oxidoreductase [Parvularcula mediterranea]
MIEHRQKTFVVTGSNTGIGFETAKAFAELGGRVILAVRDEAKGQAAADDISKVTGNDKVAVLHLDLGDLASIRKAAEALKGEERIDILVNNAGLATTSDGETKDGFELIAGVNHIGTFAFTEAIMGKLLETARTRGECRVINLSSAAHQFARKLDPEDLFPEKRGMARDAYSESKLMNLLHVREMARRYGRLGIRAHAVHPGFVSSDFGRSNHFPGAWQAVFMLTKPLQISPAKGARTTIAAALSDDGAWNNGVYWDKEKPATPTLPDDPDRVARMLWDETERLLAEKGFIVERDAEEDADLFASQTSTLFPNGL